MSRPANYYSVYGLAVGSEFDLPELPVAGNESVTSDVHIGRGVLDPIPDSPGRPRGRRIRAEPGICRLTYDSIGTFLVEAGERVVCDPVSPDVVDGKVFRRVLENEVMAVVLLQRGLLVLHASAVSVGGSAAVFLGPRTTGKSTTAAAFHVEGYSVLGDDVIGIRFGGAGPTVVPGVPQLRLSPDAVDALGIKGATQPADDWGPDKRYLQLDERPGPTPLGGCYLIGDGKTFAVDRLSGREPFFRLVTHTYAQGLLSDTETTVDHFKQCSAVVEAVSIRRLRRPKTHDRLPQLVELVERDLIERAE